MDISEENIFEFTTPEEKLAYNLISGKDKREIAKELIDQGEVAEDHVWEFIYNFEQHLLGGSTLLGKHGGFFKDILNKFRSSPQGRKWLRNVYEKHMIKSLKCTLFCIAILIATIIVILLMGRNKWIELLGGLMGGFGGILGIIWTLIGFVRWYKVRD